MPWSKEVFFLICTLLIGIVSVPAFRRGWKYAGPRALAFAAILGLVLINLDSWMADPLAPRQLGSWLLLLTSIALALHTYILLRGRGHPLGSIDFTTSLVTTGVYRFIRHPLYASLICLAWGSALKRVVPLTFLVAAAASLLLYATAKLEEGFNLAKFGLPYADYLARTKMFVPLLI